MSNATESQLIEKVQQRDSDAFDKLVKQQTPALYHFVLKLVADTQDAEDILQDTFVRVWEKSR